MAAAPAGSADAAHINKEGPDMRSWIVTALAVSLVAAPVGASAASPGAVPIEPASERVGGNGESAASDNTTWYIVGGVALLILILLLASGGDDEELPVSP